MKILTLISLILAGILVQITDVTASARSPDSFGTKHSIAAALELRTQNSWFVKTEFNSQKPSAIANVTQHYLIEKFQLKKITADVNKPQIYRLPENSKLLIFGGNKANQIRAEPC